MEDEEDEEKMNELAKKLTDIQVTEDSSNPREDVVIQNSDGSSEKSSKEIMDEMKEPMEASTKGADNPVTKGEGGKKHTVEGEDPGSLCAKGGEVRGAEGGRQPSDATPLSANDVLKQLETQGHTQMFAVTPLPWCAHLDSVTPVPSGRIDTGAPCEECGDVTENWICLVCYKVFCSRFVNEHMLMHGVMEEHLMCLSFSDLSVWCYGCDHYIDNVALFHAKNAAHCDKFGSSLPTPPSLSQT